MQRPTVEHREADALVLATGQLNQPALAADRRHRLVRRTQLPFGALGPRLRVEGKRVAVVGTGASAVQFVPEIARKAGRLTVFQRTGNWFLPRTNRRYPRLVKAAIEQCPASSSSGASSCTSTARRSPRRSVIRTRSAARRPALGGVHALAAQRPAATASKVWPDYTFGCKRVLFSSAFLPTLRARHVEVVTEPIERVVEHGLVTADGALHELDCIVWGTGFKTNDFMFPMRIDGAKASS